VSTTKKQYEQKYIEGSGMPPDEFYANSQVVQCRCGMNFCEGWLVVPAGLSKAEIRERTKPRKVQP